MRKCEICGNLSHIAKWDHWLCQYHYREFNASLQTYIPLWIIEIKRLTEFAARLAGDKAIRS
jgi:hypothetical protein